MFFEHSALYVCIVHRPIQWPLKMISSTRPITTPSTSAAWFLGRHPACRPQDPTLDIWSKKKIHPFAFCLLPFAIFQIHLIF